VDLHVELLNIPLPLRNPFGVRAIVVLAELRIAGLLCESLGDSSLSLKSCPVALEHGHFLISILIILFKAYGTHILVLLPYWSKLELLELRIDAGMSLRILVNLGGGFDGLARKVVFNIGFGNSL
jgi:hypothetical protein